LINMPSLELNRRLWSSYDWRRAGEEWSENWGDTSNLWYGTLMPRLSAWLGNVRAVEIGPGHGRLTDYLRHYCRSLVLVDIAPNCIEFCRQRFADAANLEFVVNDGQSLAFLPDASIDLVFSFDSLVHTDREVIGAYLGEIERVLHVGGHAMIHHSNLAAVLEERAHRADDNFHMRARDVRAEIVADMASRLETLECRTQELISWDESLRLIDCISTFVRSVPRSQAPADRFRNPDFYPRARELRALAARYQVER
jgi:ubiquinone/menaquinone biosynthesis C-methylase UbiE